VIACLRVASADPAADALKQGIDAYKVGKYADAAAALEKAYQLAPKPDTLFALAQAERLAGDCKSAAVHYHKVIEQIGDLNVVRLVQQNLGLCEKFDPPPPPPPPAAAPAAAVPPQIITKTVVREVDRTDKLAVLSAAGGALALGAAGGLWVAGSANRSGASSALTLDAANRLNNRAQIDEVGAIAAAAVGVGLFAVAVYRWTRGGGAAKADVALAPGGTIDAGTLWPIARW
jgi:hypothetical protein